MAFDDALAERIRTLLRPRHDVVEKRMFGGLAFMIRGHMGCGVVGATLMVRVNPTDADRLIRAPHARPMDFTGRPMRGFVFVDPPGIATTAGLRSWIRHAIEWADAQPVKPTRPAASPKPRGTRQAR